MKRLRLLLQRPLLLFLLLFLFLEFLPVSGKNAAALRLYECEVLRGEYRTYYALQPDGDLISWGRGPLDRSYIGKSHSTYPYFMRQTIAHNVTDFACTQSVLFYVDENHVLRGNGSDEGFLRWRGYRQVWLIADVEQVVADAHRVLVLKTDGSVWFWSGRYYTPTNQKRSDESDNSIPEKIADNIRAIFLVNGNFFAITGEDVLLYWDTYKYGEAAEIARDVESVSTLYLGGTTLYQYLSRQGEVYTIQARPAMKVSEVPIANNVMALCEEGFIRADHSLWTWQGTAANGGPVKTLSGVRTAANAKLYTDIFGRLHWRTSTFRLKTLPQPIRWLNPDSRKAEAVILCVLFLIWLLYKLFE